MGRARGVKAVAVGLPKRRQGRPVEWTEERIRRELTAALAGRSTWPTQQEFRAAGRRQLLEALSACGGIEHWAQEMGLGLSTRQAQSLLSPAEAVAEAHAVIDAHGSLRNTNALRQLGHNKLATFIAQAGGVQAFTRSYLQQ